MSSTKTDMCLGKPKKIWYAPHEKEAYGDAEIQAVVDCLNDGWLAGFGPRTVRFEEEIAKCFGKNYGLFVNSGSSAILLGLCALDLEKDSEVITPGSLIYVLCNIHSTLLCSKYIYF